MAHAALRPHELSWAHKDALTPKHPPESTGRLHNIGCIQWSLASVAIALFLSPRSARAMTTLAYSKTQIEQREPAKPALISIFFFLPLTGAPVIRFYLGISHWDVCNYATSLSHSCRVVILLDDAMLRTVSLGALCHLLTERLAPPRALGVSAPPI